MRHFKRLLVAAIALVTIATSASAQFRFGVKAGVAVNDMHFNSSVFNGSNRAGFTGGLTTEFNLPVIGIGMDASVMYAQRTFKYEENNLSESQKRSYIDIPVNFKWKIGIPVISKIVTPYITTGPDFSFLLSKNNMSNAWHNRTFDCAWTVGAGLQLVSHLQVGAAYGWGLTKSASNKDALYSRNRCWTITAAYLF